MSIIYPLLITILIEFFILVLFFKTKNIKEILLYCIIINTITNPLANLLYRDVLGVSNLNFLIIELLVFLLEIFLIKFLFEVTFKKAILVSFSINLITASLSFVL